jgi:hypothetical protein
MEPKELYDVQLRGTKAPEYTAAEDAYRSNILNMLQMDYILREQTHMELDDKTYSEYYLINRQQDMAYNPPRKNNSDSRIVSGITHEKDNTILSIIDDMNFLPKVQIFDKDDVELEDAGVVLTARLKKTLIQENFKQKQSEYTRVNIAQGNVFIEERTGVEKFITKKIQIDQQKGDNPFKYKWKTIVEKERQNCESFLIPNTAVFMPNLLERDLHKQDHVIVVMHIPTVTVAQFYKDFPRWECVPKYATRFIPNNVNGIWGDYFLQQPADKYTEVIMYQSEARNEYQVFLNGVMMYPVQEENGVVTGFPLEYFSPSGRYTIIKGDNEPIPFFAYGKSVPSKTEVKEETLNELMRLMVYKMRQAAKPPVGNNSDKILQANIWDPGIVTPDISKEDISILTPNAGITSSDFSFYKLTQESIGDSSVNATVEGQNDNPNITLGQYTDQKKQSLKKLGISLDNTINFLKEFYWMRLFNEIQYVTEKKKRYNHETGKLEEAFSDFMIEDSNSDGTKSKLYVRFTEDNTKRTSQDVFDEEQKLGPGAKIMYVRPDYIRNVVENLRDKMYISVLSEPEGQGNVLLSVLFNLLTQYGNLRGGSIPNLNYEYIDKLIGQNSGFQADKLFIKAVPSPMQPGVDGLMPNTPAGMPVGPKNAPSPGKASAPKLPMNPQMNHVIQ